MTTAPNVIDVTRYAQEYERLRSQVNGVSPQRSVGSAVPPVRGLGLALLLREGLPAWMRAVRQVLSEAAASAAGNAATAPRAPAATSPLAAGADGSGVAMSSSALVEPERQHDLTTLLASLVLSARRTTDAASMKEPSPCH
jgi:hypothetical protein